MNRWQRISRIGGFEFRRFFKWKQEVFSLLIMGALFAVTAAWGVLKTSLEETRVVAVVAPFSLPALPNIEWHEMTSLEAAQSELGERFDGILEVTADAEQGYGAKLTAASSGGWQERMKEALESELQQQKLVALSLTEEQIALLNEPVEVLISIQREDETQSSSAAEAIPVLILISIMVGVFNSFGLMMTAITQEKQQRVTEQLLTLISPSEWIDGKILGITLHCLKSMATVIIIILLVATMVAVIGGDAVPMPSIDWGIVLGTLAFGLVGLVMINAMMAGFAATIDDPNHSGRTAVMLIPILFVGAGFGVMDASQGVLAQALSWFPLTSFAVMPIRIADGGVSGWVVVGSLCLLVFTTYLIRSAAIRLFSMGITMYGKEPSWRAIGRAMLGRLKAS